MPSTSYDYQISYPGNAHPPGVVAAVRLRVFRALHVVGQPSQRPGRITRPDHCNIESAAGLRQRPTCYLKDALGTPRLIGPHNTDSAGRVTFAVRAPARGTTATYVVGLPATDHFISSSTAVAVTGT